jgi:hypothetical protein
MGHGDLFLGPHVSEAECGRVSLTAMEPSQTRKGCPANSDWRGYIWLECFASSR